MRIFGLLALLVFGFVCLASADRAKRLTWAGFWQ